MIFVLSKYLCYFYCILNSSVACVMFEVVFGHAALKIESLRSLRIMAFLSPKYQKLLCLFREA